MTTQRFTAAAEAYGAILEAFIQKAADPDAEIVSKATDEWTALGEVMADPCAAAVNAYADMVEAWERIAAASTDRAIIDQVKGTPIRKRQQSRQQEALRAAEGKPNEGQQKKRKKDGPGRSLVTAFSNIEYTPPEFLVRPYIPMGKLTIMQGDPSAGKTAVACSIAAHVSTGTAICGHECKQRPVLLLSYEDDVSTLSGRLEANGADRSKVYTCDREKLFDMKEDGEADTLTLTDPRIEEMVKATGAGLVIFDPIQAFIGSKVDIYRSNETRPILASLQGMAERNNCAVVIIQHLNKQGGKSKSLYRGLGSMDIPGAARSVIHIGRDPENRDDRALLHVKSSNAREGEGLAFEIGDRGMVTWKGLSSLTYEDLERAISKKRGDGIAYEDEPMVKVIRALISENPDGVFVTNKELCDYATERFGYAPAASPALVGEKVRELQRELLAKDRLIVTPCKKRPRAFIRIGKPAGGSGPAAHGVEIRQYTPQPEAYQQTVLGVVDN